MTINNTGQVLLKPHSGTNSPTRKTIPNVMRKTGPLNLGLPEIDVMGGYPIICHAPPFILAIHRPFSTLIPS